MTTKGKKGDNQREDLGDRREDLGDDRREDLGDRRENLGDNRRGDLGDRREDLGDCKAPSCPQGLGLNGPIGPFKPSIDILLYLYQCTIIIGIKYFRYDILKIF